MATKLVQAADNSDALSGDIIRDGKIHPEFAELSSIISFKSVHVDPKRAFREAGAARDEVILVKSGLLSKFKTDSGGRKQIVALRFPGEGIVPRESIADYGLQAIVKSELLVGKVEDFHAQVDENPTLSGYIRRAALRNLAISYEWLVNTGRRDSTARVAHLICETAYRSGIDVSSQPLTNPYTQQQIAEITGQTSVNVNRVFADLERMGLIERKGRDIHFTDWAELRRLAEFQSGYLE